MHIRVISGAQRQLASRTLGKLLEFLASSFAHLFIHSWAQGLTVSLGQGLLSNTYLAPSLVLGAVNWGADPSFLVAFKEGY